MQNFLDNVLSAIVNSMQFFTVEFILYIPKIIAALLILALGIWFSKVVYTAFISLFEGIRLDALFEKVGLQSFFHEVGIDFSISEVFAWIFKFFVSFVTLLSVLSILGLNGVVDFIKYGLVALLPTIITVSLLLVLTFAVADRLKNFILHSTLIAKNFSPFTARVVWVLVVVVGFLTVLDYLSVAQFLVNVIGYMFVAAFFGLALAFGLAFGLGAKEEARCFVRNMSGKSCDDLDCGCDNDMFDDCGCDCDCEMCDDGKHSMSMDYNGEEDPWDVTDDIDSKK